jgi:CBS domain-containing protein
MSLITASHNPPLTLQAESTVLEACEKMRESNVGAVAVISKDNRPIGIFTERDAIHKVLAGKLNPESTTLSQVMTSPCLAIPSDRTIDDALAVMISKSVHHLALIDEDRKLLGLVSYRTLMRERVDYLNAEVDHLSAYMGSDGIGGD